MTEIELLTPTKIIRSKRRSIGLQIDINGDFILRVPIKCGEKEINNVITQKAGWIIEKRTQHIVNRKYFPLEIKNGEKLNILGKTYEIMLTEKQRVKSENNVLFVPNLNGKNSIILFLKKELKNYLNTRLIELAKMFNFTFKSFSISSAKTNWGSCSFSNKLHFSYKLAMCPPAVVDYIILHELTHTKIKNHGAQFYAELNKMYPAYKRCEQWLKENKEIISVI